MAKKKWFQEAVSDKPPYKLGWKKIQSERVRRQTALASRPKNWTLDHRRLSVSRALQALANVTKDSETKRLARIDAEYFRKLV